jgi:hypothetical protein
VIRYGDRRQPSYAWAFDRSDGLSNVGYGEFVDMPRGSGVEGLTRTVMLEQLELLLPGTVTDGDRWRTHHLPCRAGAGTSRKDRCCWPGMPPGWSTR